MDKKKLLKELQHYYNTKLENDPGSKFEVNQVFENLLQLLESFSEDKGSGLPSKL